MFAIILNIILSVLMPSSEGFNAEIDNYINSYFAQYDSVHYSLQHDLNELRSPEINYSRASNRIGNKFFIPVRFIDRQGLTKEKFLTAEVELYQKVFVAIQPISKGDKFCSSNTMIEIRDVTDLIHNPFIDEQSLSKKIARYNLQPGNIICEEYLEDEPIMNVGDQVNLFYQYGSVFISLTGTVRQAGASGEVIKIKANNQQYSAKVINSNDAIIIE